LDKLFSDNGIKLIFAPNGLSVVQPLIFLWLEMYISVLQRSNTTARKIS